MNILIIGSGGREHAFAWKLKQSPRCRKIFMAPGNGGTAEIATNLPISVSDFNLIKEAIVEHAIDLLVVGPEEPLVYGLVDELKSDPELKGLMIVGPGRDGARLEGSKEFSKGFMEKHGIPTASARTFDAATISEGLLFLESLRPPYVLKADGLAAGKGVVITEDLQQAKMNLEDLIMNRRFGESSARVLVEEFLAGIELSVFVLTDGEHYRILAEAKDYKRIGEGDTGPNTGGMGAISPVIFADPDFMKKVEERVVQPTIAGLRTEKIDYCGFIFIGLMNVNGDPYVIEYNVRMGDPETEVVIPRLKSDLVDVLEAAARGNLDQIHLEVYPETAATVVLVSEGYPGTYAKGHEITLPSPPEDVVPFQAGTIDKDDRLLTNGGRVLAVTAMGKNLSEALDRSYAYTDQVRWQGKTFRRDIGQDLKNLGQ